MESLILARIQFAANISFHIIFPMISIALTWLLLFFKLRYNKTGEDHWMNLYRLFVKVFALTFALGVVSGITMSFQFGTNWPGFMETVGNIAGPMLAYEVLTAFFLEASFLGIMLFGFKRVSNRIHTLATLLVAIGTTVSAFWILALNSWMHTPAGFEMIDGQAHATDWFAIIFNPSFPYRLVHTVLASGLTAAPLRRGARERGNRSSIERDRPIEHGRACLGLNPSAPLIRPFLRVEVAVVGGLGRRADQARDRDDEQVEGTEDAVLPGMAVLMCPIPEAAIAGQDGSERERATPAVKVLGRNDLGVLAPSRTDLAAQNGHDEAGNETQRRTQDAPGQIEPEPGLDQYREHQQDRTHDEVGDVADDGTENGAELVLKITEHGFLRGA